MPTFNIFLSINIDKLIQFLINFYHFVHNINVKVVAFDLSDIFGKLNKPDLAGTTSHCVFEDYVLVDEILDWQHWILLFSWVPFL